MRLKEFLSEDYNQELQSDLNNVLIAAKGSGATKIQTADLVNQLSGMGYSVNVNSILPLLTGNPSVTNATADEVNISGSDSAPAQGAGGGGTQDNASKVSALAQKANSIK